MNYKRIYDAIIERAKPRGLDKKSLDGYFEKHHIIPRCMGGPDEDSNYVLLTAREHFICHQLLWKSNKENRKLFLSYWILSHCKSDNEFLKYICKLTSRQFEKFRIINAETTSKRQLGRVKSTDEIEKNRIAHIGKKHSAETNAKKASKGSTNPSAVRCSIDGIEFGCLRASLNYAKDKYCMTKKQAYGAFSDPLNKNFIKHTIIEAYNAQKVSINGTIFNSRTEAYFYVKNEFGIGNTKMMNRIKSDEWPDWFVIEAALCL